MKEMLCLIHTILSRIVLKLLPEDEFARNRTDKLGKKIDDFSKDNLSESEKEFIRDLHEFCMDIKRES